MKFLNTKSLAAFAFVAAFSFCNAQAMNTTTMPLTNLSGVSSSDLQVTIEDSVTEVTNNIFN